MNLLLTFLLAQVVVCLAATAKLSMPTLKAKDDEFNRLVAKFPSMKVVERRAALSAAKKAFKLANAVYNELRFYADWNYAQCIDAAFVDARLAVLRERVDVSAAKLDYITELFKDLSLTPDRGLSTALRDELQYMLDYAERMSGVTAPPDHDYQRQLRDESFRDELRRLLVATAPTDAINDGTLESFV